MSGEKVNVPRRRRSWYERRLRARRTFASAALVALIAFICWENAPRLFPSPAVHGSQDLPDSFWKRALRQDVGWIPPHANKWPKPVERIFGVYPYSVVPGGFKDAEALRKIARNDRAVARHFAHFDYSKAHLVRVTEPREVYVSYRIRDTVFWTRKKIRLRAGELLLTDGKIEARVKCGNQVSEIAMPEVSEEEPEESLLEEPVALPPTLVRPVLVPAELPTGQPIEPPLYTGRFIFPYVPVGGGPIEHPKHHCTIENGEPDKKCHHKPPRTPEPSTMILIASGLALIVWQFRARRGTLSA